LSLEVGQLALDGSHEIFTIVGPARAQRHHAGGDLLADARHLHFLHSVALFHQMKRLPDHLAGGGVAPRFHIPVNEAFQFRVRTDAHR